MHIAKLYYTNMLDPYKMVFINLITSAILLTGVLLYIYVYPKKKINLFILLLIISILPLVSLLRPGDYESGDFNIHIYRIMSFYDSLKEGILMPSWAAELNATYGNPLFIFNYSLPYYFISLFHFLGSSFIVSMKIYLGIVYFLSGVFMYLWMNKFTKNNLAAFTSAIFYLFNPYHLIDIHFRATLGESTVFALAPLVLLFITLYFEKRKFYLLLLVSLSTSLLTFGHPLLAIAVLGIIIMFTFVLAKLNKNIKLLINTIIFLIIGTLGSIYLWVPFILYAPYMFPNPSPELNFNPYYQLFFSPWRYGFLFQGPYGELALFIGYTQIAITIISVIILFKQKINTKIKIFYSFWIALFFFIIFLIHPLSRNLWNYFPIFWMFIPTGRLLLPLALCTSVIAGYLALYYSNKSQKQKLFLYVIIILTIGTTILNWGHRRVIPEINDNTLRQGVWKSTVTEGITAYFLNNKWADKNHFWFSELPKGPIEVLKGKSTVEPLERTSIKHTYIINAETPITVKENTLFFPGWELTSNNKAITIYPGKRGVINAQLPKGLQYIELKYDDWSIYKLSKIVSATIFIGLILSLLIIVVTKKSKLFISFFTRNPKHFSR
jgi:hypothetical protein